MATLTPELGVMLQGGETEPPPAGRALTDTWLFTASGGWISRTRCPAPWWGEFVLDAESGRVLLFEDRSEGFAHGPRATWAFDPSSSEWTFVSELAGPATVPAVYVTYDAESDRIVHFGLEGTWTYDFNTDTWTEMNPATEPPGRDFAHLAYDVQSDRVILFGGATASYVALGDTWAYDVNSNTWTEMSPAIAPTARFASAMTYDPVADRMLLFGGADGPFLGETPMGDTWAYDVNTDTWTNLEPASAPPSRAWHAMAFDPSSGQVVLFGGGPDRFPFRDDTWIYDPAANSWMEVPAK